MRIGIKTNPHHTTWDALLSAWRRADEREELTSAWVFDHFYPIMGDPDGPCLEAWTTLTALTQATERIRVGSMVNGMPYRHPAVTANMASSLDIISDGRFELGLGAGWYQLEADAYGISLGESLTERFDRFDEGVEIIVGLMSEEYTTFEGEHFTVTNARNEPKGPQRPHPPIVIGGGGEKRTLRTVARFADHWNLLPSDESTWKHKKSVLERHCADVGRDPSEIECSTLARFDGEDQESLAASIRGYREWGVDAVFVNVPSPQTSDHVDRIADVAADFV